MSPRRWPDGAARWRSMSPERQQAEREARRTDAHAWWTPERRAEAASRARSQYEAWAAEHPDRAALVAATWAPINDGTRPRPVAECGHAANPIYDWERLVVTGWRCRRCRVPAQPEPPQAEVDPWI